ncbi:MAG: AAA family ATPase [Proteobacteria bacterium]|jgi:adenylylsulfate kinase-like enzyme|nr:AAA family ATPase [Pseudomonadota bacterium]MDA1300262.1 AAA family ATPase [Pseudomonadota bacterium]
MHLIFLHGVPGVGKRTVAMELARELHYPFLNLSHLGTLLGPVFGYSSPQYNQIRDQVTRQLLTESMSLPEDGIISSFTFEPSVPLDDYGAFIKAAQDSGGIGIFVGLTCDEADLKDRVESPERANLDKVNDFHLLEDAISSGVYEIPTLPGPSITINTSGESVETTVQNILAMLPNDMKLDMGF